MCKFSVVPFLLNYPFATVFLSIIIYSQKQSIGGENEKNNVCKTKWKSGQFI